MTSKILIGNISSETTEEMLREILTKTVGKIVRVDLPQDAKTRKSKGYAIVELPTDIAADQAIAALDGFMLDGRALSITLQSAPPKRKWFEFRKR